MILLFTWFFLVEPWSAFSIKTELKKNSYEDASKKETEFDSVTYFKISKDDNENSEIEKNCFSCDYFTFTENIITFSEKHILLSNVFLSKYRVVYSHLKLFILNSIIRI